VLGRRKLLEPSRVVFTDPAPKWLPLGIIPAAGQLAVKDRINAITLATSKTSAAIRNLFGDGVRTPRRPKQGRNEAPFSGWRRRNALRGYVNKRLRAKMKVARIRRQFIGNLRMAGKLFFWALRLFQSRIEATTHQQAWHYPFPDTFWYPLDSPFKD